MGSTRATWQGRPTAGGLQAEVVGGRDGVPDARLGNALHEALTL